MFEFIAFISFITAILALYVPPQPSLAVNDTFRLQPSENFSTQFVASVNDSTSAPVFRGNLNLDFLGPNGYTHDAQPVCGDSFGTHLKTHSCFEALQEIPDGTVSLSFGNRGHGYDIQLPRRFSSSDGTCVIDIFHKDGVQVDWAILRQITKAASLVLFRCVQPGSNYVGGYIRDVGVFKNLVIVVSAYKPVVQCYGSVGKTRPPSQALLDMIPTTLNYQGFGLAGVPGTQVILPRTYRPQGPGFWKAFYATFDIWKGLVVTARWFDLWAAVASIDAICVRKGTAGKAWVVPGLVVKVDRRYNKPTSDDIVSESFNDSVVETA